jgi:hypothetical protein
VPYTATAVAAGGQSGVFVVSSGAPASTPSFVTHAAQSQFLAYGLASSVNSSHAVTGYSPATYLYAATDTGGNLHIYGLDLTSVSTPAPVQVSNLSLPLAGGAAVDSVICDSQAGFTNVLQPQTLFVVLHIKGPAGCNRGGDVWEVVHFTDAPATAPMVASIFSSQFTPLYAPSGALSGLLLLDPVSHNVYDYGDDTFTSPAVAVSGGGITALSTLYSSDVAGGQGFAGTDLYFAVTINSTDVLYRLSYNTATAASVYTANGRLIAAVHDDGNLYFSDVLVGTSTTTQGIWQVPLAGGTPMQLFTYTVPVGTAPYQLIGSNGSSLAVLSAATNSGTGLITDTLGTLTVGTMNSSVQPLTPSFSGTVTAFLLPATAGVRSSDLVFASAYDAVAGGPYTFASAILGLDGSTRQALTVNSYFLIDATSPFSGDVLQLTGIDAAGGGMGGGPIQVVNLSTLAATTLKASGGGSYTLPVGDTPQLVGVSAQLGAGSALPMSPAVAAPGLFFNLGSDLMTPINITATAVTLF